MDTVFKMTHAETKLAELLWANDLIASQGLLKVAEDEYGWDKTITLTNLNNLVEKGLAKNENYRVSMLYKRDDIVAEQCCRYVDDAFGGSLLLLAAAYMNKRVLPQDQLSKLKLLVLKHERDNYPEEEEEEEEE